MAVRIASPVSPGLAIDHLAWLGWSPPYSLAHLGVVGEAAGGEQHALAGPHQHRLAVADRAHADDAAVLDDQLLERRLGPDRDPPVERDLAASARSATRRWSAAPGGAAAP